VRGHDEILIVAFCFSTQRESEFAQEKVGQGWAALMKFFSIAVITKNRGNFIIF